MIQQGWAFDGFILNAVHRSQQVIIDLFTNDGITPIQTQRENEVRRVF